MIGIVMIMDEDSESRVTDVLGKLIGKTSNIDGGLRNIGEALMKTHRERFMSEEAPDGSKWKALSGWTLSQKKGPGILKESGRLLSSMNYSVSSGILEFGFNTVYAAAQQYGSSHTIRPKKPGGVLAIPNPKGNRPIFTKSAKISIPPRPYLGFGIKEKKMSEEAVEEWLDLENL